MEADVRRAKEELTRYRKSHQPRRKTNKMCRDNPVERQWGKTPEERQDKMVEAFQLVGAGQTIRSASRDTGVPFATLRRRLLARSPDLPKMGRKHTLSPNMEQNLATFIGQSADLGFGLTVAKIKSTAYEMAVSVGRENKFNSISGSAGHTWWLSFKER